MRSRYYRRAREIYDLVSKSNPEKKYQIWDEIELLLHGYEGPCKCCREQKKCKENLCLCGEVEE